MAAGEYSLNAPIGNYTVKAIKSNYNVETSEAEVLEGQTTEKNFQLGRGEKMAHIFFAGMESNTVMEFYDIGAANGTIAASNEQAKTGTYSLKTNITLAGGNAWARMYFAEEVLTEFYIRLYYYLPTATYNTINVNADSIMILAGKTFGHVYITYLQIYNNAGTVELRYNNSATIEAIACPSRDTWHCIETYHKRDAAAGAWQWWVDGASQGNAAGVNTGANNIRYFKLGVNTSVGMTGAIYLDNIVMATSRIHSLMGNIPQGNALRKRVESPQGWVI